MSGFKRGLCLFGPVLLLALSGCADESGFDDLDRYMEETRNAPRGVVEPLPEFQAYEAFNYRSSDRRAPFQPPVEVQLTMREEAPRSNVQPDTDRPKELLEQFSLDNLNMVGTLRRSVGEAALYALVRDAQGGIHRVRKGNHMGQNYGRVVGIDEGRIELVEIVPNGRGSWIERPRSLTLDDGGRL